MLKPLLAPASPGAKTRRRLSSSAFAALALATLTGFGLPAQAAAQDEPLRVTQFQFPDNMEVVFELQGVDPATVDFYLQRTDAPDDSDSWEVVDGASFQSLSKGKYRVTQAAPFGDGFYRIVAYYDAGPITAEFASTAFSVLEGDSDGYARIVFSAPFTGTIEYVVSGNAESGEYESLPGSIAVTRAIEARIPVRFVDDETNGAARYLSLQIKPLEGVTLGAASSATVLVDDNDATWIGKLVRDGLEAAIELEVTEKNGVRAAVLKGAGSSVLPAGSYPVSLTWSESSFAATALDIALPADSLLLERDAALSISFAAVEGVDGQVATETQLQGTATVTTRFSGASYLDTASEFTFYLNLAPTPPTDRDVALTQ